MKTLGPIGVFIYLIACNGSLAAQPYEIKIDASGKGAIVVTSSPPATIYPSTSTDAAVDVPEISTNYWHVDYGITSPSDGKAYYLVSVFQQNPLDPLNPGSKPGVYIRFSYRPEGIPTRVNMIPLQQQGSWQDIRVPDYGELKLLVRTRPPGN